MTKAALPPCRECGACCATEYDDGTLADMEENDVLRLGPRRLKLYGVRVGLGGVWEEERWATASVENKQGMIVCRALRGSVGKRVSCRIYADRPAICKAFPRHSEGCLDSRRQAGLDRK